MEGSDFHVSLITLMFHKTVNQDAWKSWGIGGPENFWGLFWLGLFDNHSFHDGFSWNEELLELQGLL